VRRGTCARVTRQYGPAQYGDDEDNDDTTEHVFAL
jgi:hypothetical protein